MWRLKGAGTGSATTIFMACTALACTDRLATTPRTMIPDPRVDLSPEQRSTLRPGIDADALERLLGHVAPDQRSRVLAYFRSDSHAAILGARDSASDALVRDVWAPLTARGSELVAAAADREVQLALVPELPRRGAGALVIREAGSKRDLIVLAEHTATPRQLLLAMRTLWQDRWAAGIEPSTTRRLPVRMVAEPTTGHDPAGTARNREGSAQIDALRRAPERHLEGIGRARTMPLIMDRLP